MKAATTRVEIRPQSGPQHTFMTSEADIVVYGGAAGGGKTYALLLDPLRYVSVPGFGAVIFRRESPQITNEGGLWDTSGELYPHAGGTPRQGDLSWNFAGNKIRFSHLQHEDDKLKWQGSQVAYLGFDELTHFTESQFFYMLSRNRSTCGVPPCVRATTNPAPGWVKTFLAPWLDRGYEDPAASGEIRYFIRVDGKIIWVDGDYRDAEGDGPKSVAFIRSTVYDNSILLKKDPGYLVNLKSLPLVEQARLLRGDWDVFEGAFFDEWSDSQHTMIPLCQPGTIPPYWKFFGGLDWGYSQKSAYAFLLLATDENGTVHVIEEIWRQKLLNDDMAALVCSLLSKWGADKATTPIAADGSMWGPTRTTTGYDGEADIEAFWRAGLKCAKADKDRQGGWSQVRRFLHTKDAFKVWKGFCSHLIEQFPLMQYSTTPAGDPNDMETKADDHLHDCLRYALMTRPRPSVAPTTDDLQRVDDAAKQKEIEKFMRDMRDNKGNTDKW